MNTTREHNKKKIDHNQAHECACKDEEVGCSCQGCGCEEDVSIAQCGCGNWQQCAIENQDIEGESHD